MKQHIEYIFFIVIFSFFFSGCEVGITALEQKANELNVVTTGTAGINGNIQTVNVEVAEVNIGLDVSVELYGNGSQYFIINLDKTSHGYQGKVISNPKNTPIVYIDTTYHFFARTVINGQKLCEGNVTKTIFHTEVPPVVENQNILLDENTSILINLNSTAIDKNGDTLSYIAKTLPKYGTLSGSNTELRYTPNAGYFGVDSFTYVANDGRSNSNVATVNIIVNNISDTKAPVITLIGGDTTLAIGTTYTDAGASANDNMDGDITSSIVISGDTVNTAIPGNYVIRYDVNDSTGNKANQQTRIVTVTNNKPVALGNAYTINEDTNLTRPLQGSDIDSGTVLTYSIVNGPANGSISMIGNNFTYTPDPDYFGIDNFTFEVRDEFNATSNISNINITINDVAELNKIPVAEDINVSMDVNTSMITFGLNASDADIGNTLTYSIVDNPAFGTLIVNNQSGQVTYNRGTYTGNTSFTYKVNDGTIDSNIATVYIRSNVPNNPPIAYEQSVNLDVSGAPIIALDANDTDIGDTLTYRIGTSPSYGTVILVGNQVTYTPMTNYTGNDSFTFIANDSTDDSKEALVYIEVGDTQLNSHLFAGCKVNDEELWRTDGSLSGTIRVKNIRSTGSAIPQSFVKIKNTYFFMANDGIHGRELWKSQGTRDSTVLVKDIKTIGNGHSNPHNLIDINGTLFFAAKDDVNGVELWKSDGTTLGTKMVKNIDKIGNSKPTNMTNVNGTLYFTANDEKNGRELWRSDGTLEGTSQVSDINSKGSSNPQYLTSINGVLYFSADDGGTTLPNPLGRELWYYNTNISDIASGYTNRGYFNIQSGPLGSTPKELFNYNGTLVFSAETQTFGRELWISDGTAGGTKMHSNYAGDNTIYGDFRYASSNPHSFVIVNGILYFSASQVFNGENLRKIDSIDDVSIDNVLYVANGQGYRVPSPQNLIESNGALFFSTYTKSIDKSGNTVDEWVRLWKASGNRAQREILFNPANNLRDMVNVKDMLYFMVRTKNALDAFWRYDTTNGTTELLATGCMQ
jgi:ELWxxDGT repeat protein